MTPSAIADSIVNLCGAIGLAVAMLALHRRDPGGPLTRRLVFLLGVVAALFLIRGLAWWHESTFLDRLSLIPAAWCRLARSSSPKASCAVTRRASPSGSRCGARCCSASAARSGWKPGRRHTRSRCRCSSWPALSPAPCCLPCAIVVSCSRPKTAASAVSPSVRCWSFPSSSPTFRRWRRTCRCGSARSARCWSSPPS